MNNILKTIAFAGFLLCGTAIYAQVKNSGFEENNGEENHCPSTKSDISSKPFNTNKVRDWKASHGSPQLYRIENKSNGTCTDGSLYDAKAGSWCAFLSYDAINCEGIFQDLKLDKDEIINLAISARGITGNSKLIIKLKNGLKNDPKGDPFPASGLSNLINASNEQLLLNQTLTTDWTTYYITNVTVKEAFSQIWIYSLGNSLKIDQFFVNVSCCKLREEYQNIVNPPSTFRNDYIKAGEMIDLNRTQGKVIIDNQTTTIFQARNKVILEPGFEVINGSKFIAQIDLCTNLSTSIEIEQRKSTCEHEYIARVCNGSGFYSFSWNLDGMEAIDGTSDYRVKFKPKSNHSVTLTVTDLATNTQTTKTVNLGYVPFTGDFPNDSFVTSNVFTPNGDGINDVWLIGDAAKRNTKVFAYDAYSIELDIWDRANVKVFSKSESDNKANGFADNFVLWNGPSHPVNMDVFFTITEFKNCYNTKVINQSVLILGVGALPPPSQNKDSQYLADSGNLKIVNSVAISGESEILVYPNPASDFLTIEYGNLKLDSLNISILDPTGRRIMNEQFKSNASAQQLNISSLNSGLYFISFEYGGNLIVRKFIKQ